MTDHRLVPGSTFAARYSVLRALKSGGMGAVYEAEHTTTHKRVALKTMRPEVVSNEDLKARFLQEARVSSLIESRHVVTVTDAGVEGGVPFLVMELLKGEELGDALKAGRRFSPKDLGRILVQIAKGLDKAHAAGVVHRDLKPENVFLSTDEDGELLVKILDFGIAKILQSVESTTIAGGTPMYMAPEQTKRGSVTPATDIWALGLIAFRLVAGRTFWSSETVGEFYGEILAGGYPPASRRTTRSLPAGFDQWFARCVALHPTDRFTSAGRAADAFASIVAAMDPTQLEAAVVVPPPASVRGQTVAAAPISGDRSSSGSTQLAGAAPSIPHVVSSETRGRKKSSLIGLVLAAAGLVSVAVIVVWATSTKPKPAPAEGAERSTSPPPELPGGAAKSAPAASAAEAPDPASTNALVPPRTGASSASASPATPTGAGSVVKARSIRASRELTTEQRTYSTVNFNDGDDQTAWGVREPKPGEDWIEISFGRAIPSARVALLTGYHRKSNIDPFSANAHLKRFSAITDAGSKRYDVGTDQRRIVFPIGTTTKLRIVIDEVYEGTKWQDLLLSEIEVREGWGGATPTDATVACTDFLSTCKALGYMGCFEFPSYGAADAAACAGGEAIGDPGGAGFRSCCP